MTHFACISVTAPRAAWLGVGILVSLSRVVSADTVKVRGDSPCPAGYALVTPEEARQNRADLCGNLEDGDIARLADSGSMAGDDRHCRIRTGDVRPLEHALCKAVRSFSVVPGEIGRAHV